MADDSTAALLDFLRSVKLFSLLDEVELKALSSTLSALAVPAGAHIFSEGEIGDTLYILQSGQVEVFVRDYAGDKITLSTLVPTDIFGETSLFDPGARSASAVALESSQLLVWKRGDLIQFLRATPSASIDLLTILSRRLREADHLLMGRHTGNVNVAFESNLSVLQRVANYIADFSGSMPFLFINAAIFFVWIVVNLEFIPGLPAFDPYPFGFLTMSVSLEAIFLSIIVLLAQNLNSAKERVRNDIEYEVNLKAERKITELHHRITQLHYELSKRMARLESSS
jgi:CRP/FNR family transcriptional regulator, cyclic AMP receptor protein